MTARAGVLRSGAGLAAAAAGLDALARQRSDQPCGPAWEATNLHLVASALVTAAAVRQETRGSHWREDYPEPSASWRGHVIISLGGSGLAAAFEPDPAAGAGGD
jgi:L-aspartate oxidase